MLVCRPTSIEISRRSSKNDERTDKTSLTPWCVDLRLVAQLFLEQCVTWHVLIAILQSKKLKEALAVSEDRRVRLLQKDAEIRDLQYSRRSRRDGDDQSKGRALGMLEVRNAFPAMLWRLLSSAPSIGNLDCLALACTGRQRHGEFTPSGC